MSRIELIMFQALRLKLALVMSLTSPLLCVKGALGSKIRVDWEKELSGFGYSIDTPEDIQAVLNADGIDPSQCSWCPANCD